MDKCRNYLYGMPAFKLITDHQPLVGLSKKDLTSIENRRLQRLQEKVIDYSFEVQWVSGKTHRIADAFSRYPVSGPTTTSAVRAILHSVDPLLQPLLEAAQEDTIYQRLLSFIKSKTKSQVKNLPDSDPVRAYLGFWDDLSTYECTEGSLVTYLPV